MQTSTHSLLLILVASVAAIWPVPTNYTHGNDVLWLSCNIEMTFHAPTSVRFQSNLPPIEENLTLLNGQNGRASSSHNNVQMAIDRAQATIFNEKFVPWKFYPRNSDFQPPLNGSKSYITSIDIYQNETDPSSVLKPLAGDIDESYTLDVTQDGHVTMTALSSVGVLRAIDTFTQLFYQHSQDQTDVYTNLAPVTIYDKPRFQHRGLNLDVARNWFPVSSILRTIDAIAWNKFNRLHLHVTDSQSWPLEIPAVPELARQGAYQTGLSYSPSDIQQIQTYATERGIEVVFEIDMPGHTASIALSYPDLITAFNIQPDWSTYANEIPSGQLKLNYSEVDDFLDTLFADLLPRLSPFSAYFHTGGDEVNANSYLLDANVKSNDSSVLQPLLQRFVDGVHEHVRAYGFTPVVWEEMLLQWNLTLGSDVVVQTWQSDAAVAQTVSKGHKVLAGNYNYWYLDCGKGQWVSPRDNTTTGPASPIQEPFTDYCSPVKSWRQMYSYDPVFNISAADQHLVLGGEVHMWSEQTDPTNLDDMLWPRAAAAGEVLWSGRTDAAGTNRSLLTAAPRLAEWRERLVRRGITAGPVQMIWCTQHDPNDCAE